MTLAGHKLVLGPGAEPPEAQGFYTLNYRQMCIFYTLFVTLAGHELVWGPGGGAPGSSGVLYIKLSSDEHIFIPYL